MQDDANIPVLTDLIDTGVEIELSELGLDEDPPIDIGRVSDLAYDTVELEQEIGRILDKHKELAWKEIKIAIQQLGSKSSPGGKSQSE